MKTTKITCIVFLLLTGFGFSSLNAQENLWKWVDKCQKDKSVEMTLIVSNNRETKKPEREAYTITVSDSPKIIKELLDAFDKDKKNAYKSTERRPKGEEAIRPEYCRFRNNEIDEVFTFVFNGPNSVVVSAVKRPASNNSFDFYYDFDLHSLNIYNPLNDSSFVQSMRDINKRFSDSTFLKSIQLPFGRKMFYKNDDGEDVEFYYEKMDVDVVTEE